MRVKQSVRHTTLHYNKIIFSLLKYLKKFEVILTVHHRYYVEIKYQLDATDDIYCRFYCMLNMFQAILLPETC